MKEILISKRGIKPGDVIVFDPSTNCVEIFSNKKSMSYYFGYTSKAIDLKLSLFALKNDDFEKIAELLAITHGLKIKRHPGVNPIIPCIGFMFVKP